jgi:hypothetical protein
MTSVTSPKDRQGAVQRQHLRLLRGARQASEQLRGQHRPAPPKCQRTRILVAGADPEQRAAVLRDLSKELPADTQFGEAGAVSEVLALASSSGVVMLAGDLDEVSAHSLMQVLGDRHPSLPVVALGISAGADPACAVSSTAHG